MDPLDGVKIQQYLRRFNLDPYAILLTHTHPDHWSGLDAFRSLNVPLYVHPEGARRISYPSIEVVSEGDAIPFAGEWIQVFHAPGHHFDHLLFLLGNFLFVGDTLFALGCGNTRFGGNLEDLYRSIWCRIRWFEGEFYLLFGHDYAATNQRFALACDPDNEAIRTYPIPDPTSLPPLRTLAEEREANPFLRSHDNSLILGVERLLERPLPKRDPRTVFFALRQLRDRF